MHRVDADELIRSKKEGLPADLQRHIKRIPAILFPEQVLALLEAEQRDTRELSGGAVLGENDGILHAEFQELAQDHGHHVELCRVGVNLLWVHAKVSMGSAVECDES